MRHFNFLIFFLIVLFTACRHIIVNEKVVDLPKHEWNKTFKPQIEFTVIDSGVYQVGVIIRHKEKYAYNNLVTIIVIKDSIKNTLDSFLLNIPLAVNNKWLGRKMDGLYDHHIKINKDLNLKTGKYFFVLEQRIGQGPLKEILNIGLSLNKTATNSSNGPKT